MSRSKTRTDTFSTSPSSGGSFMAQGPGPQLMETPVGGFAVTVLG